MENHLNEEFMRMAINLAEINLQQGFGGPFGAVVVKNGAFIAGSANKVISDIDPTAHAEVCAIRLACHKLGTFDLSGCDIYTSCEPCPMCLGAIYGRALIRYIMQTPKVMLRQLDLMTTIFMKN